MSAAKRKVKAKVKADKDLVFGLGVTGLSVARYLKRIDVSAMYYDSRAEPPGLGELQALDPDADIVVGAAPNGMITHARRIIVSPGIPDDAPLLQRARELRLPVVSDIELFVEQAGAPIVALTGSNGKSTVTSLLALMCKAAGRSVRAGANLGTPALDLLDGGVPDFYVLELSSFQLHRLPALPASVAGLLNISPDHLDWHASEDEYRAAKYRVFREASAAVFNRADADVDAHLPAGRPRISFGLDEPAEGQYGVREDDGIDYLARGDRLLLSVEDMVMIGRHNQANALAALAFGELMGLGLSPMLQVLNEFPGLPHRMQVVRAVNGVTYINDSKATNVGAALASVESVNGAVVLVAGGVGKGGDFAALAAAIHERLRCAVLIGQDGPAMAAAFRGLVPAYEAADMHTAVSIASTLAREGDTVLLAPACASLDMYRNYQHRGDDFRRAVEALKAS